nr:hypothetical protein Iba_chr03bCG19350 [Ipomoea batatas]GMC76132.1 hypothetical protein Iba_chr03dCG11400 [Ipomoea batatas]GMC78238.1 hypothetical protein Iba_chr03fCG6080 [Ipomoea batatas]
MDQFLHSTKRYILTNAYRMTEAEMHKHSQLHAHDVVKVLLVVGGNGAPGKLGCGFGSGTLGFGSSVGGGIIVSVGAAAGSTRPSSTPTFLA